jgi:hypothetical protein
MTWSARGYRLHFNKQKLSPLVKNSEVFRGYDVSTDHHLLISTICLPHKWYAFTKRLPHYEEVYRVHLLHYVH